MKHMVMSPDEQKKQIPAEAASPSGKPKERYPYGLQIRLGTEEMRKLGIKELPAVGTVLRLEAKAKVERVSASASQENSDKSVELQITHMEVAEDGEAKNARTAEMMFPKTPKAS